MLYYRAQMLPLKRKDRQMNLENIFSHYKIETIEQLASGKIPDIDHIRLPREVLVDELKQYLLKYSHVQRAISLRNPPSFLILNEIIEKPDCRSPVQGFKETIVSKTESFIKKATKGEGLRSRKDYSLYFRLLQVSWESGAAIDQSEAALLEAVRDELDIAFTEHIVLEHHESLKAYWYTDNYYEKERNHLIASGIIHPVEGHFVVADEMVPLIRKTWGYLLTPDQYRRLLLLLNGQALSEILKKCDLPSSGSVEEKAVRIVESHISPKKTLFLLGIEELREISRAIGAPVSGSKADVIENIIDYLDSDEDLKRQEELEKNSAPPQEEEKALPEAAFRRVFGGLSNEQLYSIAANLRKVNKTGPKPKRIQSLWDSLYSEKTMLGNLSNAELYSLCAVLDLKVSGSKQEKIDRIVESFANYAEAEIATDVESNTEEIINMSTKAGRLQEKERHVDSIDALKSKFPFLSEDQLIVLSFLIENRSASGHVIERIVARFDLPWYFPEAQMNEMVQLLRDNGHDIVSVQHYGDHPLYQIKDGVLA